MGRQFANDLCIFRTENSSRNNPLMCLHFKVGTEHRRRDCNLTKLESGNRETVIQNTDRIRGIRKKEQLTNSVRQECLEREGVLQGMAGTVNGEDRCKLNQITLEWKNIGTPMQMGKEIQLSKGKEWRNQRREEK